MERSSCNQSSENLKACACAHNASETVDNTLEIKLNSCTKELADYKERFIRLNADFDNARRRAVREQMQAETKIREQMLKNVLIIADTIERALAHARTTAPEQASTEWIKSLELIQKELTAYFAVQGVTKIEVGAEFDPTLHEAIATVASPEKPSGAVVEIARTGYLLYGSVLRPAQVTVAQ